MGINLKSKVLGGIPMEISPEVIINDLEDYLNRFSLRLTKDTKKVFFEVENIRYENNCSANKLIFLISLINNIQEFKELFIKHDFNIQLASFYLMKECILNRDENDCYFDESNFYSIIGSRDIFMHTRLIDICIKNNIKVKKEISKYDVLEALLEDHEYQYPEWRNYEWSDYRLYTNYNTLSHILESYYSNLWIKFDEIRNEIIFPREGIAKIAYQIVI